MYLAILTLTNCAVFVSISYRPLFKFPYNLHIRRWERTFFICLLFLPHGCASLHRCMVASNIMDPKTPIT